MLPLVFIFDLLWLHILSLAADYDILLDTHLLIICLTLIF